MLAVSAFGCGLLSRNSQQIPPAAGRDSPADTLDRKVAIKVSLDGWDSTSHECYQIRGSFQPAVAAFRKLRGMGCLVGVKTVVHYRNIAKLDRMLDMSLKLNAVGFSYNVLRHEGRARYVPKLAGIDETDIVRKLMPKITRPEYVHLLSGTTILRYLLDPVSFRGYSEYFHVDCAGLVYPNQLLRPSSAAWSMRLRACLATCCSMPRS